MKDVRRFIGSPAGPNGSACRSSARTLAVIAGIVRYAVELASGALVVALVVVATVGPAEAEFTEVEKASLLNAYTATHMLMVAYVQHVGPFMNQYTARNREEVYGLAERCLSAIGELRDGTASLLGVSISDPPSLWGAKLRADKLAWAWFKYDRALGRLAGARAHLKTLAADRTEAAYQHAIRRTDELLAQSEDYLKKVDRTLPYAFPNPPDHPKVIGPHGSYDDVQWHFWRGSHYADAAAHHFLHAYRAGLNDSTRAGKIQTALGTMLLGVHGSMFLTARIPWTAVQAREDPFFRIVHVHERTTSQRHPHVPSMLFDAIAEVSYWVEQTKANAMALTNVLRGNLLIGDAWRHTDEAAWMLMIFPGCDQAKHPRGCAGRGAPMPGQRR